MIYDEYGNPTGDEDWTIDELFERNYNALHVRKRIRFHREQHGQDPTFEQVEQFVRERYVEHPCAGCDGPADYSCEGCDPEPAYCYLGDSLVRQFAERFCAEAGIAVE